MEHKGYPKEFLTTAYFIESTRKWFDYMSSRDRKSAFSYRVPEKYAEATAFVKDFSTMMCNSQVGETDTWKPGMTTNPIFYFLSNQEVNM